MAKDDLSHDQYRRLLELRTALRGFLHWSEAQAKASGLSPHQHQLLLAVVGHDEPSGPTIGTLADYLYIRHHSAVGLVARAEAAGLIYRVEDPDDARVVRLRVTSLGLKALRRLSALHVEELGRLAEHLQPLLTGLQLQKADRGGSRLPG